MTKRSFFKSIASIVATVALAPEIAFGRKLEMPAVQDEAVRCHAEMELNNGNKCVFYVMENSPNTVRVMPYSDFQRLRKEVGLSE